jgi:hypothetical protein
MTTNVFNFALLTAVVIVAGVFGAWYLIAPPDGAPAMYGRIEGTTTYPGEYIPPQVVCAEPVSGGQGVCVDAPAGDNEQLSPPWSIEVPPGEYYISARLEDPSELGSELGDYRAYYTQYVLCGMDISCTDHSKVSVTVTSDRTTSDITPYDWYIR